MAQKTFELKQIIQRFSEQLEKMGIHTEKTLLYGSQANDTAREGSDIDLIIISKDWEKYGSRERLETLGVAAAQILEPVQGKGFTPEEAENQDIESFWGQIIRDYAVEIDMKQDNIPFRSEIAWEKLDSMTDEEIDFSDSEEVTPELFAQDVAKSVQQKEQNIVYLDSDILNWFRAQGKGYQTRINETLRTYMTASEQI